MVRHLNNLAAELKSRVTLSSEDLVLDLGCNDGTLLRAFIDTGADLMGMDPTAVKFRQYHAAPDAFLVLPWHFRRFIVAKEQEFIDGGGSLVFPLPALEVITNGTTRMERASR
jgi:hypothetical protein